MKRPPGKAMLNRARSLRRDMTPQEAILWGRLRNRRLDGFKFRQQMWLCGFIADFACIEGMLIVEADGSQHGDDAEYDARRAAAFVRAGYRTIRFWNNEITRDLDGVLTAIRAALPSPSHPAPPGGPLPLPEAGEGK
jgi:very-short-patch-repair endonuclease